MKCKYEYAYENIKEHRHPIFVVGHARSGTGLTVRSLNLSPKTCYLGETYMLTRTFFSSIPLLNGVRLANKLNLFSRPGPFYSGLKIKTQSYLGNQPDIVRLVRQILRYCKLEKNYDLKPSNPIADIMGVKLTSEDIKWVKPFTEKYQKLIKKNELNWLRILFEDCRLISQRHVVLEKTPLHILCIPLIWQIFPDAKIIATFRENVKEVLASYYLMTNKIRHIKRMFKVYKMTKEQIQKNSYKNKNLFISIKYEDWLDNPKVTWDKIFNFADIEPPKDEKKLIENIRKTPSKFNKVSPKVKTEIKRLIAQ